MHLAYNYIKDHSLATEKDYPYKGFRKSCTADESSKNRFKVTEYKKLPEKCTKLLSAFLKINPVSVAIEVQRDFQSYKSGVYKNHNCGSRLNHGVLLVG